MKIKCEDCIHSEVCGIKDKNEIDCKFHIPRNETIVIIPNVTDIYNTVGVFRTTMNNKGEVYKAYFEMKKCEIDVIFKVLPQENGEVVTMTIPEFPE